MADASFSETLLSGSADDGGSQAMSDSMIGIPEGGEAPDYAEQQLGDAIDNAVPTHGYHARTVVGLGGSAGSLSALRTFFQAMPPDTGLTFVVVTHLLPDHESLLAEILQRVTAMPVVQVTETVKVLDNCVYVIPPSRHLLMMDGHLQLAEMERERGRRVAVDLFLRTLADTHGPHAIGIILSGADADGAIGIKRIKERGGLTIVQEPEEAEMAGMPRSAIATGMADWVLRMEEMPERILGYLRNGRRLLLPPENPGQSHEPPPVGGRVPDGAETEAAEGALRGILTFLRTRTGRDFTCYKRATTLRRIARRMQVNNVTEMTDYLTFLRMHPGEAGALLQDLLISVTNFFRDRDAFEALEKEIPNLFKGKRPGDQVRVWVAGCATGEEAYSVAMLLAEHAGTLESPISFQIFATDLDDNALQQARAGVYPDTIAADVPEERLRRFFTRDSGRLRIKTELRERVLFALHDLFRDSPFSRLDLITCRNLFIYVNREVQQNTLEVFQFALRPEGRLFLGSAESVDAAPGIFAVLDKKQRIFSRSSTSRGMPARHAGVVGGTPSPPAFLGAEMIRSPGMQGTVMSFPSSFLNHPEETGPLTAPGYPEISGAELHLRLQESVFPPSLVVDSAHNIVHMAGHAGRWLMFSGGQPTHNLLRLVHPVLRLDVRAALFRAAEERGITVVVEDVPVETEGGTWKKITLKVSTPPNAPPGFCLVVFEEREAGEIPVVNLSPANSAHDDWTTRHLEGELEMTRRRLTEIQEQNRASMEEMKAGNEELQAMNEELRSAGEELVTSREELQSMNEELQTVNQEMKSRVEELSHTNADLQNLMGATNIATIFLDRDFRIKRYTPPAMSLFNLIPSDLGRPLFDLAHHLDYPEMASDARSVLTSLVPIEKEVRTGHMWFLARLLPYRTGDDHIAGLVLSFVDITGRKSAETELRESEERQKFLLKLSDALRLQTEEGQVVELVLRLLVEELDVDRCFVAERLPEEDQAQVRWQQVRPPAVAVPPDFYLPDFPESLRHVFEQTAVFNDMREIPTLSSQEKERLAGIQFGALVSAVLRQGEKDPVRAMVAVTSRGRIWQPSEAALLEEVAGRMGSAVERHRAEMALRERAAWLAAQKEAFQAAVAGAPLQESLGVLGRTVMGQVGADARCAFYMADPAGATLHHIAGMPDSCAECLDGLKIGPDSLACGLAVYKGGPVVTPDIAEAPEWEPWRWLAEKQEYRACWSFPISSAGRIIGTFAMYFREPREVTPREQEYATILTRAAAIIISQHQETEKRIQAENSLKESTGRLRLIMENARDYAIFTTDLERGVTSWNSGAERLLGFAENEILGLRADLIFTEEDRKRKAPQAEAATAMEHGRAADERWHQRKDGSVFWGSGTLMSMFDDSGKVTGFVKILRDQTEARENLLKLQLARAEAEAAGKAKDHFLAVLSHELRTPLTPVSMEVECLLEDPELTPALRASLEMIDRNVAIETKLIEDLLDVTRIGQGKLEISLEPVHLHHIIQSGLHLCSPDLKAKGHQVNLRLEAAEDLVTGDSVRLQQVFWNLLKNAAKFTPADGLVRITSRSADGFLEVEVADNGMGWQPEVQEGLFDAFTQADESVTKRFGGLGLGLAISKAVILAHHGSLHAHSAGPGQGAQFKIRIPLWRPPETE